MFTSVTISRQILSEDIENIKILEKGIFLININSLLTGPVVVMDSDGVYHVKISWKK